MPPARPLDRPGPPCYNGRTRGEGTRLKRALVFSGGGSRGSYEIGVWQALEEAGLRFHMCFGTSIGAINAALFLQGDRALAARL